jgi:hypothetical protein
VNAASSGSSPQFASWYPVPRSVTRGWLSVASTFACGATAHHVCSPLLSMITRSPGSADGSRRTTPATRCPSTAVRSSKRTTSASPSQAMLLPPTHSRSRARLVAAGPYSLSTHVARSGP